MLFRASPRLNFLLYSLSNPYRSTKRPTIPKKPLPLASIHKVQMSNIFFSRALGHEFMEMELVNMSSDLPSSSRYSTIYVREDSIWYHADFHTCSSLFICIPFFIWIFLYFVLGTTATKSTKCIVQQKGKIRKHFKIPKHIAVIMDGNRRFGVEKYGEATRGHRDGSQTLVHFVEWCQKAGIQALTVFAFSTGIHNYINSFFKKVYIRSFFKELLRWNK